MTTPILLIGKPDSGKTTFLVQFHARVDSFKSALTLYKSIENLTPIIDGAKALANGEEVKTTPSEKSTIMNFPLLYDNMKIDLDCPDYGGEQINLIIENREVDSKWSELIRNSNNWIVFIRPTSLSASFDLSNKTIKPEVLKSGKKEAEDYVISDQSFYIELLQILLFTKGQDAHFRNSTTKLTIVLTCWDELKNPATPNEELRKNMPLFLEFIESNWVDSKINILGLSSLGFNLNDKENQRKYRESGSENFGYMIKANGQKILDITQLLLDSI